MISFRINSKIITLLCCALLLKYLTCCLETPKFEISGYFNKTIKNCAGSYAVGIWIAEFADITTDTGDDSLLGLLQNGEWGGDKHPMSDPLSHVDSFAKESALSFRAASLTACLTIALPWERLTSTGSRRLFVIEFIKVVVSSNPTLQVLFCLQDSAKCCHLV